MITAAQLRAARGLLDWSRSDLSKASKISQETIKNIEHGVFRPQETTEMALIRAFAGQDVQFLDNDGVKKSPSLMTSYEGNSEFRKYVDNFYRSLTFLNKDDVSVCAFGVDDRLFIEALGDYTNVHAERMSKLKGLHFRSIVSNKAAALFPSYIDYRVIPNMPMTVLFGIYGQYFDLTIYGKGLEFPKVAVIKSGIVVEAYRPQFESMWNVGKPL
jgi:DNA-binding XRE family transcriptional regulator